MRRRHWLGRSQPGEARGAAALSPRGAAYPPDGLCSDAIRSSNACGSKGLAM